MSALTIFSAPKPYTQEHIAIIQRNAVKSWLALGDEVEVILIGEEEGLAQEAKALGVTHLPEVQRNALGTPLLSSIFSLARQTSQSPLMAYINADILIFEDFLQTARQISSALEKFLVVGQRWDLDVNKILKFDGDWQNELKSALTVKARLH